MEKLSATLTGRGTLSADLSGCGTQQLDEVVNARVGANGTTYSTLGDAIRGQVTDLKSALEDEISDIVTANLLINQQFNLSESIPNGTGSYKNVFIMRNIAVTAGDVIHVKSDVTASVQPSVFPSWLKIGIIQYDANNTVVVRNFDMSMPITVSDTVTHIDFIISYSYANTGARYTEVFTGLVKAWVGNVVLNSNIVIPGLNEVVNARVGADGTTYDSVGTAIRTQVTDLKSAIDNVTDSLSIPKSAKKDDDIFSTYASHGYLNYLLGNFTANVGYNVYLYQIEQDANIAITQLPSGDVSNLVGAVVYSEWLEEIPTSSTTAQSYYVYGGRSDKTDKPLPTSANPWSVRAGQMLAIFAQDVNNPGLNFRLDYTGIIDNVGEEINDIKTLASRVGTVSGNGSTVTVTSGKMKYVLMRINSPSIHANIWRVYSGAIKNGDSYATLWNGEDADGVVRLVDEDDFLGGYHGDEIMTSFRLFIDGVESASLTFSEREFTEIVAYQESDIYHCNTSAHPDTIAFKRNKIMVFNKDGYTIKNHWTAQETLTVQYAYFGMLTVRNFMSDGVTVLNHGGYTNADYKHFESTDRIEPASHALTNAVFNTACGDVTINMVDIGGDNYKGYISYYSTGSPRQKVYLGPINNSAGILLAQGDVLRGEAVIGAR